MDHSLNVSYSRRYTEKTEKKKTDILKNWLNLTAEIFKHVYRQSKINI